MSLLSQLFGSASYWPDGFGKPATWSSSVESGASIMEGAWEKDEDWYYATPSMLRHFWNPDVGYQDGILAADSALEQAQYWWTQALLTYPSNKALAYYSCGGCSIFSATWACQSTFTKMHI